MNIAFIGNYEANTVNGVSVSAYYQAQILIDLGHTVYFYFPSAQTFTELGEDKIIRRGFKKSNKVALFFSIYDFLKKNTDNIDIFHLHSVFYPINNIFAFCLIKLKYKYVIMPHGGYNENIFKRNALKKSIFYTLLEKSMILKASAIFCVAEKERLDIERLNYKGAVYIIPNPINLTETYIKNDVYASNLQEKQSKSIIYLGRYDLHHKGIDTLLEIFKKVEEKNATLALHLYGKGKDKEKMLSMIKQLNLHHVFVNDAVFGEEKLKVYQQAIAYIQTSRWEAFGMSIFEAGSIGLPLIVSEGVYMKDFILDHDIGIVICSDADKASEQIIKFCMDSDKLKNINSKIREVINDNLSIQIIGKLLENAYQKIIAEHHQL
jgi:glycosyltransferase involved in cell wall biosynthesis